MARLGGWFDASSSAARRWLLWGALVLLVSALLVTLVWLARRYEAGRLQERIELDAVDVAGDIRSRLARNALFFSLSILIAFALMTRIPLDPLKPVAPTTVNPGLATVELIGWLLLYYAIIIVPFFFAGLTIGTALSAWAKEIGSLYFADLLGAGLGAAGIVLALYGLTGQGAVTLASVGAALGALAFSVARMLHAPNETAARSGVSRYMPWALGIYAILLLAVVLPPAGTSPLYTSPRPRARPRTRLPPSSC